MRFRQNPLLKVTLINCPYCPVSALSAYLLQHVLPLGLMGPPSIQTVGREGDSCVVISIHHRPPNMSELFLRKFVISSMRYTVFHWG